MPHLHDEKVKELEEIALEVRQLIIDMLVAAGSGHSAGPLGMADIFVAMYFHILHHDPKNPMWPDRDRLILSNGHIVPVRYATMARAGYFPIEDLKTLRKFGSPLQGHPERTRMAALETTSGPLGGGLSQAAGMAYAARLDSKKWRTYCLMSDAEQAIGLTYEAMIFAGKYKLSNLTAVIDRNNIQIDGHTEDVMPIEPLREKYEACGWHVIDANGHNIEEFVDAVEQAKAIYEKPTLIIAHTIPGRGISFMEGQVSWHGLIPNKDQTAQALNELRTLGGKIRSEHE